MSGRPPVAVVVAGGDAPPPGVVDDVVDGAWVIAADSGADHALALGLRIDVAVGDFDSISADGLAAVEAAGTRLLRHPTDKDQTDLELALDHAVALGVTTVIVVGGHGGRVDHFLANALLLTAERYASVAVEARFGDARVQVLRSGGAVSITGRAGELVSLLAVGGPAQGVTTEGLRYPLVDDDLAPTATRGVSNELTGTHATIRLRAGRILVIRPG